VKRRFRFAFVVLLCAVPLQCATLERLSLDDMIAKSTSIVRGKITGSYTAFSGPVIYTHYTIQVTEKLKGSAGATVDIAVPGGTARGLRQSFSGTPAFQPGDEFVFLLWISKAGLNQVIGLTQGLFSVANDGTSDPMATRSASHELMLDAAGRPVKDQTLTMHLSELRNRITGSTGGK
jgi:hypothetical protein